MATTDLYLLTYDVRGEDRLTSVKVAQLIHGRRNRTTREGVRVYYNQPGFLGRPGVVEVEQSVLLLPERDAEDLRVRLEAMGAHVLVVKVSISEDDITKLRSSRAAWPMASVPTGPAPADAIT